MSVTQRPVISNFEARQPTRHDHKAQTWRPHEATGAVSLGPVSGLTAGDVAACKSTSSSPARVPRSLPRTRGRRTQCSKRRYRPSSRRRTQQGRPARPPPLPRRQAIRCRTRTQSPPPRFPTRNARSRPHSMAVQRGATPPLLRRPLCRHRRPHRRPYRHRRSHQSHRRTQSLAKQRRRPRLPGCGSLAKARGRSTTRSSRR